jgi:tartrate dehydrogenase/decarboxylase/D-malate dehydrogenase
MKRYDIAVIPGDGIGKEVMVEGTAALEAAAAQFGFEVRFRPFDWSCESYKATGAMMPADGIEQLRGHDAIFLGAVGFPGVPDHISLWGLLIPIRRSFDQYINLRPVRLLRGVRSPLRDVEPGDIDFWIVRENSEGEYSQLGGRQFEGTEHEMALQTAVFTRRGCDRAITYAFELARKLGMSRVDSATKSNGIYHSMPFWDERFAAVAAQYPDIKTELHHVDIMAARFVMQPQRFEVVVHGSAPDIAGKGVANPIGQIWSAAMMLDHLGEPEAAAAIVEAIEATLTSPGAPLTPDLGGTAKTGELGGAIARRILKGS